MLSKIVSMVKSGLTTVVQGLQHSSTPQYLKGKKMAVTRDDLVDSQYPHEEFFETGALPKGAKSTVIDPLPEYYDSETHMDHEDDQGADDGA